MSQGVLQNIKKRLPCLKKGWCEGSGCGKKKRGLKGCLLAFNEAKIITGSYIKK